jgi:hypothetical protein
MPVEQYVNAEVESDASTAATSQVAVAGDEYFDNEVAAATVASKRIPDAERPYTIETMVYGSGASFNDGVFEASPAEVEYHQFMEDLVALERAGSKYCAGQRS